MDHEPAMLTASAGPTARTIAALVAHPRRASLPLESVLSLPVPILFEGRVRLAFFWTSQGGPAHARRVSAPYCRSIVAPWDPAGATFEALGPGALDIPAGASLPPTIGAGVPAAERKAFVAGLHALTDDVAPLYADHTGLQDEGALATLQAFRDRFDRLAVVALRPAYRALSPHFFAWLEMVAGPNRARAGGVYAVDAGDGSSFRIVKVLAVEPGIVHARLYRDGFATRPERVAVATLTIGSGHVPLSPSGFASWNPSLLECPPLADDELAGYRQWRDRPG